MKYIPNSERTHLPATNVKDTVNYQREECVPIMQFTMGQSEQTMLCFSHKDFSVFVMTKLARNDCVWYGRWKGPWQPICWAHFVLILIVEYMLKA